jgi:hypothetical protein
MAHAPGPMIARRPANDKRAASRARRTVQPRQLDLFRAPRAPRPFDAQRLTQMALGIWAASAPVVGGPGAKFFEMRRLEIPDAATVRFHPSLKHGDGRAPGLVWLLRDVRTDEPCGCMRVYLDECGWPIAKRILGRAFGATLNRAPRPP